jgi:hypothetical protein
MCFDLVYVVFAQNEMNYWYKFWLIFQLITEWYLNEKRDVFTEFYIRFVDKALL